MDNIAASIRTHSIRLLNDRFRATFTGGQVVMTRAVSELPPETRAQVLLKVRKFREFTENNDPYDEHDFAGFQVSEETYFFKIDYYGADMQSGSEDPADHQKTTRVLTIMRADEY